VFVAAEYYLPLYFQSVKEASPVHSGVLVLPILLTEALASIISGLVIHRVGRYLELIRLGTAFLTIGTGLYIHFDTTSFLGEIIGFQIVAGTGAGLLFSPPLIALHSNVAPDDTATTTATFGLIRNVATSMSIVIGGVVFQNSMQLRQPELQAAGLPADLVEKLAGASAMANIMVIRAIPDTGQQLAVKNAFTWSLRNAWILYTCVAAGGLVASVFITKQLLSQEHTETRTGIKTKRKQDLAAPAIKTSASKLPTVVV
jgi:MFS family permease